MKQALILTLGLAAFSHLGLAQNLRFSINLREYGWKPDRLEVTNGEREIADIRHLGFDSEGRLYVGFAIAGENRLLKPSEANNIFRVLTLDSESGVVQRKLDFATQSKEWVGLNVANNDALLVTANNKVQLIGDDSSPKAVFDIPMPPGNHILSIKESASGKTLLVSIYDLSIYYFLHANTLSPATHCTVPPEQPKNAPQAFSDDAQLSVIGTTQMGPPYELVEGPLCGEVGDLWSLGAHPMTPDLLDGSTVLELDRWYSGTQRPVLEAKRISGEPVWSEEFPKHFGADLNPICTTRDGSRFAVEVVEQHGGNERFDISPRTTSMGVWIYNARTGKRVSSIKYPRLGPYEFTLSPNGDEIAILSADSGSLQVWNLPSN